MLGYDYYCIDKYKNDDRAFIFTLKNPHGVEPTRFMKRNKSLGSTYCNLTQGPTFCETYVSGIHIYDECDTGNECFVKCDDTRDYECHPQYKSSLFVNTAGINEENYFYVLDDEVYCLENYKEYVYNTCKYPDLVWNCMEGQEVPEETLKQFDDDTELLNDLNLVNCYDKDIRSKISQYYLKNPSEFLSGTHIVNQEYDSYLRKWLGQNSECSLIYRASEHGFTAESFHDCCNNKGPTLVIIKSDGGWIFGGFTTQSWSGGRIYTYDVNQ